MGPKNVKAMYFVRCKRQSPPPIKQTHVREPRLYPMNQPGKGFRLRSRGHIKRPPSSPQTGTEAALNRGSTPLYRSFRQITAPAVPG